MSVSKAAIVRCLRGAFVADIASMGTHWIYDPQQMAAAVPSLDEPEFKTPPTPNYYSATEFPGHYGAGMPSPYGEQLLWVVQHLVDEAAGVVDGPAMLKSMVAWAESYSGRPDSALKAVVQAVREENKAFPEAGADDHQAHCFLKAIPVTCLYVTSKKPQELTQAVEQAIRVHQNNDQAVTFGVAVALILQHVLLNGALPDNLQDLPGVPDEVQQAWNKAAAAKQGDLESLLLEMSHELMKGQEDSPFYNLAARSCALPGSFVVPTYLLKGVDSKDDDNTKAYATAVRQNILGAGDTCSRAIVVGGILGALGHEPPQSWIDQVDKETMQQIDSLAEKLANLAVGEGKDKNEL